MALSTFVSSAVAHVVFQRRTLRQWAQKARVIVVAEVTSPLRVWSAADGSDHQEYFSVRVTEVLAGEVQPGALDLFAHAEGEPRYKVGDTALLFLDRTAEHSEFAPLAKRFPLFTSQGAGHEWTFDPADRTVVEIGMAWRSSRRNPAYESTMANLIRQLESSDRRLQVEAVTELAAVVLRPEFRRDARSIARLESIVASPALGGSTARALRHLLSTAERAEQRKALD